MFKKSLATLCVFSACSAALAVGVDDSVAVQSAINDSAAASQKKIDKVSDKTSDALQSYRAAVQRAESLEIYNAQLQRLVASQTQEMLSIREQTEEIDTIETGVLPLMVKMVATLEKLVDADAPFLLNERRKRVTELTSMIDRADISIGEKYRRIMEAYSIEVDYGRTIEAYGGEIVKDSQPISVDFLRIGRVGLYYQTLDGLQSGVWDKSIEQWQLLTGDYRRPVRDGLRVARKQAPPELLILPVSSPE